MTAAGNEAPAQSRIEDFGEHIPGARKDASAQGLARGIEADPRCAAALAVAWPLPQWTKVAVAHAAAGRDRRDLAAVRAMRDELRTAAGRDFERAAANHTAPRRLGLRGIALGILDERWSATEALEAIGEHSPAIAERCESLAVLYAEIGHETDLAACSVSARRDGSLWFVRRWTNHSSTSTTGATLAEAAHKLGQVLAAEREAARAAPTGKRKNPYSVRYVTHEGEPVYGVYRQAAGRWKRIRECESLADARRAVRGDIDELDRWWNAWREIPAERRAENAARTPAGGHGTADPEEFTRQFGFRGVQFGNWVGSARRQADLLETSEALSDLARVLGWPERALSLGGRLGLAFGARGKGGPRRVRAHYEPLQRVVAISKPSGPGTLAHEWFHALDHHAALLTGHSDFASELNARTLGKSDLENVAAALAAFGAAVKTGGMRKRSVRLDSRRPRTSPYWSTVRELAARAFEAWVVDRLAELGIRNDYLVNFMPAEEWPGKTDLDQGYPYPFKDERFELAPHIARIGWSGARVAAAWTAEAAEAIERSHEREEGKQAWAASTRQSS